jgi:hypothetical protein
LSPGTSNTKPNFKGAAKPAGDPHGTKKSFNSKKSKEAPKTINKPKLQPKSNTKPTALKKIEPKKNEITKIIPKNGMILFLIFVL